MKAVRRPRGRSFTVHRTGAEKIVIVLTSAAPLVFAVLMARLKLVPYLVAVLEMPLMLGLSFAGGFYWYRLLTDQLTASLRAQRQSEGWRDTGDGFAILSSLLLGFSIGVFLMEVNSHEMVRPFTFVWDQGGEDN